MYVSIKQQLLIYHVRVYTFRHVITANIGPYLHECMKKEDSMFKVLYMKLRVNFVNYEVGFITVKSKI
jgi:hypothetical protein